MGIHIIRKMVKTLIDGTHGIQHTTTFTTFILYHHSRKTK